MTQVYNPPPAFLKRRASRKNWSVRGVIWSTLAALGLLVIANLPLIYAAKRFSWATFADLWKLAPHQFFFTAFCIPIAVWLTCVGLWWVLRAARQAGSQVPARWQPVLENWPLVFLIGLALAALISAVFFVSSTWSPDKLRNGYPVSAVAVITSIEKTYAATGDKKKIAKLDDLKAQAASVVDTEGLTAENIDTKFFSLSDFQKAQVALTKDSQQKLAMKDEAAVALSAFQVMAIVSVAGVLLLTCGLLLLLGHYVTLPAAVAELQDARLALVFAICAFVPYPYMFGLYRSELERVVKDPDTGGQEIIAMIAIILAALLVMVSQPRFEVTAFSGTWAAIIAVIAVVGTVAPRLDFGGVLRQLVGFQSTIATQFSLVIVWAILAVIAIGFTLPKTP